MGPLGLVGFSSHMVAQGGWGVGGLVTHPLNGGSFYKTGWHYCWWKKSCTTCDTWNYVNNGINYFSTGAGFLPSTVGMLLKCLFFYNNFEHLAWNPSVFPWFCWLVIKPIVIEVIVVELHGGLFGSGFHNPIIHQWFHENVMVGLDETHFQSYIIDDDLYMLGFFSL